MHFVDELSVHFLKVVETAAIAAAKTMGQGDRKFADFKAVEAMRKEMDKIEMDGTIVINAPVATNLKNIARGLNRDMEDLVIIVLNRDHHNDLISQIRKAGARIKLIGDGDLSAGIAAAMRGTGMHAVMGISGAPEGVLTAAAVKCLNGDMQAKLFPFKAGDEDRVRKMGIGGGFESRAVSVPLRFPFPPLSVNTC